MIKKMRLPDYGDGPYCEDCKEKDEHIQLLKAENERLKIILGFDTQYPVTDILAKLSEAVDILFTSIDYDGHGHETIKAARDIAIDRIQGLKQENGGKGE